MARPDENQPFEPAGSSSRQSRALVERRETLPSTDVVREWMMEEEEEQGSINLRHYWAVIMRRKWTVLTFMAIVMVAGWTATYLQTPIYRATGTLQIEPEEKIIQYQEATPGQSQSWDSYEHMKTQLEILRSRAVAERVVTEMNLTEHPLFNAPPKKSGLSRFLPWLGDDARARTEAPRETTVALSDKIRGVSGVVQGGLSVEQVGDSRLVRISFSSPDAKLAADVVNSITTVFINMNLARRIESTSYAKTFLQDRLQQVQAKLEDSEKKLVDFARQQELVKTGNKDEQDNVDTQVLQTYTAALTQAQQDRIKAESLYNSLQGASIEGLPEVMENDVVKSLKERKTKLEAEYREGLKIYKPAYPKMQQLESQIEETRDAINAEIQNVKALIKARYQAALAQETSLMAKQRESKMGILSEQERSIQYNILKREVDTNRELFEGLLQRLKEIGVGGGVGTNNISVVDRAEVPGGPFTPNPQKNLMMALLIGLLGGIGLAFFFEHLDDTIKAAEELEQLLGLPVLGVIPFSRTQTGGKLFQENFDTRSHFAEAHRSLRTALQFSTPEGMPKVLMITSTSMGEGKSTTALSLAMQIAQAGKKVLIIDSDLRKASLHANLELDNQTGLTNYLAGDAKPVDITSTTEVPNLYAIPSGPLPPNPAELIGSSKMVALLSLAAEKFDAVIVDGPPVLGLADAPLLGSIADATILVVEVGGTRRDFAKGAVKRLRSTRTHLIGGVLTKMRSRGHTYDYYYSGHYYQYGGRAEVQQLT
jgi:capsular exopolysaccharide synthesis family protein